MRLNSKHREFAILMANGLTQTEASIELRIHKNSATKWMRNPEIAALIERERELRLSQVRGLLTCHAPRAARVITEMMVDDGVPAADRRQAAVKVLEFAGAASAQQIRVEQRIVGESLSVATPELLADLLARAAAGEAVVLPDDDEEKEP